MSQAGIIVIVPTDILHKIYAKFPSAIECTLDKADMDDIIEEYSDVITMWISKGDIKADSPLRASKEWYDQHPEVENPIK